MQNYAWTAQMYWVNWIIVFATTFLLYTLSKKRKHLAFMIATCSWVLFTMSTHYFIALPLLLAIYIYHENELSYILYPILSILLPYVSLVTAIVHTWYSKGKAVYTLALACSGFLFSLYTPLPNTQIPSTYIIIGILALTTLLLKNIRVFTVCAIVLVIGILSNNAIMIYSPILYSIAWYLQQLHNQKWSMPELKQICVMAIITMILFSTINMTSTILTAEPQKDTLEVLQSVEGTIIILPRHELAANIAQTDHILANDLVIPNSSNVEQLQRDGFLVDNIYVIPYTKIIVETMKLNNATHILYDTTDERFNKGIYQALISEEFILVSTSGTKKVYTYAN